MLFTYSNSECIEIEWLDKSYQTVLIDGQIFTLNSADSQSSSQENHTQLDINHADFDFDDDQLWHEYLHDQMLGGESDELPAFGSDIWLLNAGLTLCCVCFAGLAAGLTMGLVSVDRFQLQVILETALEDTVTPAERDELAREQHYAKNIMPLVSNHHYLLVTLLLLNSLANEALPIFLDEIVPSYIAIILSVTLVLFFGNNPNNPNTPNNSSIFLQWVIKITRAIRGYIRL